MILETDGNMIAGKVATHNLDDGAPLSEQVHEIQFQMYCFNVLLKGLWRNLLLIYLFPYCKFLGNLFQSKLLFKQFSILKKLE